MRLSDREFRDLQAKMLGKKQPGAPKKSKYNNKRCTHDGWSFDSLMEGDYYLYNKLRMSGGLLSYQLLQVPFRLPGKIIYRVDFLEVYPDNAIRYVDIKGSPTKEFIIKKRQVEELYPGVKIICVKKSRLAWVEVKI